MSSTRRYLFLFLIALPLLSESRQDAQSQQPNPRVPQLPNPNENRNEDRKLPNGKSQNNEIAKQDHEQALKDVNDLLAVAQQLKDELQKAGNYVVPVSSLKKTEEIEKLARRIRGRLKD